MKTNNIFSTIKPIEVNMHNTMRRPFNLAALSKGKFVYEGYTSGTRYLRYINDVPLKYSEVRNYPKRGDIRTHNIDFYIDKAKICIENNNSQFCEYTFDTPENAKKVFRALVNLK